MQQPTAIPVEGTDIVRIVVGAGRLDVYNAPVLRDLTVRLASELKRHLILDLGGVHDADSTGLGVIWGVEKRMLDRGGKLVLVNVGVKLANTLRITGLAKRLTIASDLESAIAFFSPTVEYMDDSEPTPADGDHGTCVFGDSIRYVDCPTGGWWVHEVHPADGHDAELGGPA